jgi:hypothetical protein
LGLSNLSININAVFDVEESSSGSTDGEDGAAGRRGVLGRQDLDRGDSFAGEGAERGERGGGGEDGVGGGVEGLDVGGAGVFDGVFAG